VCLGSVATAVVPTATMRLFYRPLLLDAGEKLLVPLQRQPASG
jgi:hypothetical protein